MLWSIWALFAGHMLPCIKHTTDTILPVVRHSLGRSKADMKLFLLSILFVAVSAAEFQFLEEWNVWKADYGKSYGSDREELENHLVWLSNKAYIEGHNANSNIFGYTLQLNQYGDISADEFEKQFLTYVSANYTNAVKIYQPIPGLAYSDELDWRTKGAVTKVKDQFSCGSSYAFSAVGALEGAYALAHGKLVSLSSQNIIDCSVSYGNHGCQGGNVYNTFRYIVENEGVDTEKCYYYSAKQRSCTYSTQCIGATMTGTVSIQSGSEADLMNALTAVGPISVAVDARSNGFKFYQGGVFDSSRCSSYSVNHAMTLTGYGTNDGKEYWLVKNSWGPNWGTDGYILMSRNKYNQCGIATDASYPSL